jgi:transglutaminase-like putative cysteine protease
MIPASSPATMSEVAVSEVEPCEVSSALNQSSARAEIPVPPGDEFVLRAGCEFTYSTLNTPSFVVQVSARRHPIPVADRFVALTESWLLEPRAESSTYEDGFGNHVQRFTLAPGQWRFGYDGRFRVPTSPDPQVLDARQAELHELPDEVLMYLLSSRYCESDVLSDHAWAMFGSSGTGWARVQAVCDWLHRNIEYRAGSSNPFTTAKEVIEQGAGICRDFANTGITFCRALGIPARYCFGYMPDVGVAPPDTPMDFHAWFEAWLIGEEGGAWHTFDARHNFPRIGRVPIARGRDAVDCAMITHFGRAELLSMKVWAQPE